MNGYAREELVGQSIDILNLTEGTNEERGLYLDRLHREGVIHIETFHRHKDGHLLPVEVSTSLFAFEGRELVLGIDRNITDRKQAEQAQLKYTAFLESLNRITRVWWKILQSFLVQTMLSLPSGTKSRSSRYR
jgi:hypothetical protein